MAVNRILESKSPMQTPGLSALTDRELHVFKAIGAGKSNKQIAAELKLSVKTIETYREHIKYKLRLPDSVQLISAARKAHQAENTDSISPESPD